MKHLKDYILFEGVADEVTLKLGFTVIVIVAVPVQPFELLPVTV